MRANVNSPGTLLVDFKVSGADKLRLQTVRRQKMGGSQNIMARSQYLTFQLAEEEYGLDIMQVREIIEFGTLTKVPRTPPAIRGVINLRGNVVPVIDLALKFTGVPSPITRRTCVIIGETILCGEPVVMGIIADAVSKVVELTDDEILPAPAFGAGVRVDYLTGMGRAGAKFLLLLNIDKVFSDGEMIAASTLQTRTEQSQPAAESGSDGALRREDAWPDTSLDPGRRPV
jgi:purine-binding chemotaxis protein CheW